MDQINPLAELTHKRRLSALGPGGLSRDRAGFEVRDVHPSHYGRICPIETPEGPNIGLIASLATFARINEFGFLETPYRKVENGRVTEKIEYLTADREEQYIVAQANSPIDDKGHFTTDRVVCRARGEFVDVEPARVDYMDVSPKQLVSIAASVDSVPGARRREPRVDGFEHATPGRAAARHRSAARGDRPRRSRGPRLARRGRGRGKRQGRFRHRQPDHHHHDGKLPEGEKENQTRPGERRLGLSDPQIHALERRDLHQPENSRSQGRPCRRRARSSPTALARRTASWRLGRNVLVAFMPWNGYNFEDAILISEKIVKEDIFTSIHIDEFEVAARDTKLGPEEITRDIPNLGDEALKNLSADGVIRVGAEVKPGDILVGKITPKSETELAPEERLLRAIFGEKAADVKDTSLKVPSGTYGIVMDVKVSSKQSEGEQSESGSASSEEKPPVQTGRGRAQEKDRASCATS